MEIEVRLFANLRDRLPGDRRVHRGRGTVELPDDGTLQTLLERLEIPAAMAQMVLLNGQQTPRDLPTRSTLLLANRDVVSIFPPLAGG